MDKGKTNQRSHSGWYTVAVGVALAVLVVFLYGVLYWYFATDASQETSVIISVVVRSGLLLLVLLSLMVLAWFGMQLRQLVRIRQAARLQPAPLSAATGAGARLAEQIRHRLKMRHRLWWRSSVRLVLVVGDNNAVEQLLPGLVAETWLESEHLVFIYGGDGSAYGYEAPLAAVQRLWRLRPLDGIVRVLGVEAQLSPQASDNDLRMLEDIGRVLRYQPPVWLWQLCASKWSQRGREEQPVGAYFTARATAQEVRTRLENLVPVLRAQGMLQVSENQDYDFLLRLSQQLQDGGIAHWEQQLQPWLYASQPRVPLRGLMFSLVTCNESVPEGSGVKGNSTAGFTHALVLPPRLAGLISASRHTKGLRPGNVWFTGVAAGLVGLLALWGVGLLVSFMVNYHAVAATAQRIQTLESQATTPDQQLVALHALGNHIEWLQNKNSRFAPWYLPGGFNVNPRILDALMPVYITAYNRQVRDQSASQLREPLQAFIQIPPESARRTALAGQSYNQLKAWLMMAMPEKADTQFYTRTLKSFSGAPAGISPALWETLAPDLWAFYMANLAQWPQWKISPDTTLVAKVREALLQQLAHQSAEQNLYNQIISNARANYPDQTLETMAQGTDVRRVFVSNEVVPGVFTRQAWEGSIQQAIARAATARQEEIDWVLSDNNASASAGAVSADALKASLSARYFADFAGAWQHFLNNLQRQPARTVSEVSDQLTLISDVRQSPLIALLNTLAFQGQTGQINRSLPDALIQATMGKLGGQEPVAIDTLRQLPSGGAEQHFRPILQVMGINSRAYGDTGNQPLSLQAWLTQVTRIRLHLQQIINTHNPQESMQLLAQTLFQGQPHDFTETRQYSNLLAASLGQEWQGFGEAIFAGPMNDAWNSILQPSAAGLNNQWQRTVRAEWQATFSGRYPFTTAQGEASLPALADFIRKDSGRLARFVADELGGIVKLESRRWVLNPVHSRAVRINPDFLAAINQLNEIADILFIDGGQGVQFELQARPSPGVVETQLNIDGQKLHYFNQQADWQLFRWPGETYKPGTLLTWHRAGAGNRLYGDYPSGWGLLRWLETGQYEQLDNSRWLVTFIAPDGVKLQWVLRSQVGKGPLALLALRSFQLPENIFIVDPVM